MAPRRASPARGTETREAAATQGGAWRPQGGASTAARQQGVAVAAQATQPGAGHSGPQQTGRFPAGRARPARQTVFCLRCNFGGTRAMILVHCEPGTVWALPACHLLSHYLMALQGPVYPTTDEETEGGETAELKGRGAVCGGTVSCDQACRTGRSALYRAPSWRTGRRWNGVKPGARAGPRRKGVGRPRPGEASGLTPLQRPQEVTVMTLGRA